MAKRPYAALRLEVPGWGAIVQGYIRIADVGYMVVLALGQRVKAVKESLH